MMACIQTLEKENAQLLAELGRSPETPAADLVTEPAETEIVTEDSSPEKDATTTQLQEQSENKNTDPEPATETNTDTTSEEVPPNESEDSDATEAPDDTRLAAESEDSVELSEETTDDRSDAEQQAEKQSEASQNEAETLDAAAIDELLETEPETEAKKSEENAA